jgi:hypothetical protein
MTLLAARSFACGLVAASLLPVLARAEESWNPPPQGPAVAAVQAGVPDTLGGVVCHVWLRCYQRWFSRLLWTRCHMKPSCSRFSQEAIAKHGAWRGVLMTADRLYHEGSEQRVAPTVTEAGRLLFLDPVENNALWRKPHDRP